MLKRRKGVDERQHQKLWKPVGWLRCWKAKDERKSNLGLWVNFRNAHWTWKQKSNSQTLREK